MTVAAVPPRSPGHWHALSACLLDFEAFPGRYPLALREPRLLFDHGTEVLALASGRTVEGLPQDAALETRLRQAARFFVRTALLRPGVDHYTLLSLAPGFDPAVLRDHYRMLIRLTHPDFAAGGDEWPANAATRVNQANDVLSSPERRHDYDLAQPRGRQWAPSVHAPIMPRPVAGPKPPARRGVPTVLRHRGVLAGAAGVLALWLGAWLWSGTLDSDHGVAIEPGGRVVLPEPAAAPAPAMALAALSPAPELAPVPAPVGPELSAPRPALAPAPVAPAPNSAPVAAVKPAPALQAQRYAGLPPTPAWPEPAPAPAPARLAAVAPTLAGVPVRRPEQQLQLRPVVTVTVAPATVSVPPGQPVAAALVAPVPVATAAAGVLPPPAPVAAPQATQLAVAAPAGRPPAARDAGTQGARVSMADVQPLLGQVLGVLQGGRGEQVLRWVESPTRPGDGADGFVQTYNRLVAHSRNVRLGSAQFSGRPMGEQLQVDGVVMLYLQDENQQPVTRELVLRAQFASRSGQPVLTQLSASEALK